MGKEHMNGLMELIIQLPVGYCGVSAFGNTWQDVIGGREGNVGCKYLEKGDGLIRFP